MNTAPIFPQVIYPIGDLPDGRFIAEVGARGFSYTRDLPDLDFGLDYDLPELDFDDDEPDTLVNDNGPTTLRPQEIVKRPWYRMLVGLWDRAA